MLHCLNTSGNLGGSCSDMTVLERQRFATRKWQQHQQQQQQQEHEFSGTGFSPTQGLLMVGGGDSTLGEVVATHTMKPGPGFEKGWPELAKFDNGFGSNSSISRTCSATEKMTSSSTSGKENIRKRKAQNSTVCNLNVVVESGNNKDKRIKVSGDEGESKITEQTSNKNNGTKSNTNKNSKETSADTSKENSKGSEVQNQKPDYIHVRARRGQATDSHSLAERVRREKISERMKYLQDLVPGCNKIAGKAGMLDEIINYVQSLQRQVEFLSMKLAAVNPRLDFNIDELFAKEAFPACAQNFPTIGMPSDMTNPAYLQFHSAQQLVSCCGGLINNMGIIPQDMGLRRNISTPAYMPETFTESSCFTQILPSSTWEGDFQNLFNVAFDQGRTTSFPSQPLTGLIEASNLKMEM